MSAITLTLNPRDRLTLTTTIERLINLLDDLDGDPDLEPYLADSRDDREDGDDNGIADFGGVADQWPNWRDAAV